MSTKLSTYREPLWPEPLWLELKPSRYLRAALLVLALCALAAIGYSAIDWRWRSFSALILLAHLSLLLHRYTQPPGCLIWRTGGWLWIDRDRVERVLLLRQATLWPAFILLRFRAEKTGKMLVFTLLSDSLDADKQRRLRVYLRHMPVFAGADDRETSA